MSVCGDGVCRRLDLGQNQISESGCNVLVMSMHAGQLNELLLLNLVDNVHLLDLVRAEAEINAQVTAINKRIKSVKDQPVWVTLTWIASLQYQVTNGVKTVSDGFGTIHTLIVGKKEEDGTLEDATSRVAPSPVHVPSLKFDDRH